MPRHISLATSAGDAEFSRWVEIATVSPYSYLFATGPRVPELAKIVQDFIDQGLVTLNRDSGEDGVPPIDLPSEEAAAILGNQDNWWSPDGTRPIAVAPTGKGLELHEGQDVDVDL